MILLVYIQLKQLGHNVQTHLENLHFDVTGFLVVTEGTGELSVQVTGHLLLWGRFPLALPTAHRVKEENDLVSLPLRTIIDNRVYYLWYYRSSSKCELFLLVHILCWAARVKSCTDTCPAHARSCRSRLDINCGTLSVASY